MDIWATVRSNDVEAVKAMFAKGIGLRARDDHGRTLLHHAAEAGATNTIAYLIDRGIEIDTFDNSGFTVNKTTQPNSIVFGRFTVI
jgi:ankyrin repeat protein